MYLLAQIVSLVVKAPTVALTIYCPTESTFTLLIHLPFALSSTDAEPAGLEASVHDGDPTASEPSVSTCQYALLWAPTALSPVEMFHAGAVAPFTGAVMSFSDRPIFFTLICADASNTGARRSAAISNTPITVHKRGMVLPFCLLMMNMKTPPTLNPSISPDLLRTKPSLLAAHFQAYSSKNRDRVFLAGSV